MWILKKLTIMLFCAKKAIDFNSMQRRGPIWSYLNKLISVHEGKSPFKCNIWDKKFANIFPVHEGNKSSMCSVCDTMFRNIWIHT